MNLFFFNNSDRGEPLSRRARAVYDKKVRRFFYQRPRRIYILPNGDGIAYLFLLGLILLGAMLEHINLTYFVLSVAAGLFFSGLVFTNYNLSKIEIRSLGVNSGFVGEEARFSLQLVNRAKRTRYNLLLELPSTADLETFATLSIAQLAPGTPLILELATPLIQRGKFEAVQVRLSTTFPFGLFRSWSWHPIDLTYFAYPRPKGELPLPLARHMAEPDADGQGGGQESFGADFSGHKRYGPGDSFRHINWKLVARGYGPHVKQFTGGAFEMIEIDLGKLNFIRDPEERLSQVCKWIQLCRRQGGGFQLKLSAGEIYTVLNSEETIRGCLERLAVWQAPRIEEAPSKEA